MIFIEIFYYIQNHLICMLKKKYSFYDIINAEIEIIENSVHQTTVDEYEKLKKMMFFEEDEKIILTNKIDAQIDKCNEKAYDMLCENEKQIINEYCIYSNNNPFIVTVYTQIKHIV